MPQGNKTCEGDQPATALSKRVVSSVDISTQTLKAPYKEKYWASVQDLLGFEAEFLSSFLA